MKNISVLIVSLASIVTLALSQETEQELNIDVPKKVRISLSYGISAMNPDEINQRIASSNAAFGSTTKSIKSMPELAATLVFRPSNDVKVVLLRACYLSTERQYPFSIPETSNGPTPIGTTEGTISETYSAYPFSLGIGFASMKSDMQFHIEFIYALAYVSENGSYTLSNGQHASYSRTLFSPSYGLKVAGTLIAPLSSNIGLQFDVGYRYILFDEFEDETTAQSSPLDFSMIGIQGSIGLSFTL